MKRVSLPLILSLFVIGCGDATTAPSVEPQPDFGKESVTAASSARGENAVTETVSGSGHLNRAMGGWRTFTIHATKSAAGKVQGTFQWRVHYGQGGSKVKGDVICFAIDGNQAWLAVLFEKAVGAGNIGKWASVWVVDQGEGSNAPADELGLRWRGFPYDPDTNPDGLDPQAFCQEHWTDMDLFPIEAGNIQVH